MRVEREQRLAFATRADLPARGIDGCRLHMAGREPAEKPTSQDHAAAVGEKARPEEPAVLFDAMTHLQRLGATFVRASNLSEVLGQILDTAVAIAHSDFGSIQFLEPGSCILRIAAARGVPQWWIDYWQEVAEGYGSCGAAMQRGERVIVEDVEQSAVFVGTPGLEMQRKAGIRACQSTPLISRDGKLLGMLSTHYRTPQRPDARTLTLLDLLAQQAAEMIAHVEAHQELRDSEQRFRVLSEAMPQMVWSADLTGAVEYVNPYALAFAGAPTQSAWDWKSLIHPHDRKSTWSAWRRALSGGRVEQTEHRLRRADGQFRWHLTRTVPLRNEKRKIIRWLGTATDIHEQKMAEQELERRVAERTAEITRSAEENRRLSERLAGVQDKERRILSLHLHDSAAQFAAAVPSNLAALRNSARLGKEAKACLESAVNASKRCMNEMRNISQALHPPMLNLLGLPPTLRWYVGQFQRQTRIVVEVAVSRRLGRLAPETEIALYRIIQESLANVALHSGSRRARVELKAGPNRMVLQVSDEGHGMRMGSGRNDRTQACVRIGIPSMRERARQVGGEFQIMSNSKGTTVRVTLPPLGVQTSTSSRTL